MAFLFSLFITNFIKLILLLVCAVDATELDVAEVDSGFSLLTLDLAGNARVLGAGASGTAGHLGVAVWGVVGVQPEHVSLVVVPQAHDQDMAAGKGLAHDLEATLDGVVIIVVEGNLVVLAELLGDGVELLEALDVHDRVLNDVAVLDVLAADLNKLAGVGAVSSDELGDDSDHPAAVNGELGARTPEGL